jgi:hypothetical protein
LLQRWNKSAAKDSRENIRADGGLCKEQSFLGGITSLSKSLTIDRKDSEDSIKILILKS